MQKVIHAQDHLHQLRTGKAFCPVGFLPKNPHGITIADDALLVLQKYTALTERNKGRLEQFLDTLSEQQAQQKETRSSV